MPYHHFSTEKRYVISHMKLAVFLEKSAAALGDTMPASGRDAQNTCNAGS
jgi:hypothetical protein